MKQGKVSENIIKRSVLKHISKRRIEVKLGAKLYEDSAVINMGQTNDTVVTVDTVEIEKSEEAFKAIIAVTNDLAASGAEPVAVMIGLLLSEECLESDVKQAMTSLENHCSSNNIQIIGGDSTVIKGIAHMIITATGIGKVAHSSHITTKGALEGQDIVVSKWCGLEGTSIIAKANKEQLLTKYSTQFVEDAVALDRYSSIMKESQIATKFEVTAMHDASKGGIYGALWELGAGSGMGLEVDLPLIPVRQETIEICEVFDLNPYKLFSNGMLLMTTYRGTELANALEEQGIRATIIGKIKKGNERVVICKEDIKFLEPPKDDELFNINIRR